jgi:hypothetical protein
MRKCSQCGQLYSDDDIFCANDGMTLTAAPPVFNAPNRVVIPLGNVQPTQVVATPSQIAPPYPQPPVSSSASSGPANWLYLVIGMLIAIVLAMGIGLFLMQGRANNSTAQSSNENKDDNRSSSNQNTAVNKPALNTISANAANIDPPRNVANTAYAAANKPNVPVANRFDRSYEGTLNNDQIEMQLARNGSSLNGKVIPKNRYADISVHGSIDSDGAFVLTEYSDLGATTGIYRGRILPDNTITGSWSKPDGSHSRPLYLRGK